MTYLVDSSGPGPRVHALIIGVGRYRHLDGGDEPASYDTLVYDQLTSPPVSAAAFARWVRDELRHPVAEPGSVDLLLSPGETSDPGGESMHVEVPSADAVVRAVDRWRSRCDSDPENVALFYFSGHGIDNGNPLLLLEDFARNRSRILDAALDRIDLVAGMRTCKAAYQYYFVDCCRERKDRLDQLREAHTLPLPDVVEGPETRRDLTVVSASVHGRTAGGTPHAVSDFTQALLDALAGRAASRLEGQWRVTSLGLYRTIHELTGVAPVLQPPTMSVLGDCTLHLFDGAPHVPLGVRCAPEGAATFADISLAEGNTGHRPVLKLEDMVWRATAPAGVYAVGVDFPDRSYTPLPSSPLLHAFHPPDLECVVDVERAP
ncbi:caspase family protein [Streptomyces sp. N50]|uniref:caspase family protein n=1 Tax=Streptomyces sp. N50 TaxID=3081765 RepID=UPI0029620ECE|nr:caspase family protein [Streptomyces sp. N50]WOX12553.1 caspase family protein [Streptomyces sp. N50]